MFFCTFLVVFSEEFFGISERLNKYEPIKAEMQNYEIDFHINEIGTDGKECLYREGVLASRVPKEFYALAQLPIVKKNILAKHRLQACISAVRAFRSSADSFDVSEQTFILFVDLFVFGFLFVDLCG